MLWGVFEVDALCFAHHLNRAEAGKKNGKYALDAWKPHLHISYYDLEFSKKIVINTENNIISITNGVYKELVNNRKNPFVHNSEPRKPKIDQEGHVIP